MNYILKDLLYSAAATLVIQNWVVPNIVELLSNTVNSSSRGSNSNETNLTDPLLKHAKQVIADIKIPYRYQTKNFYQYIQTSINKLIKAGDKNFCEEIYVLPKINTLPAVEIGHRVSSNKHKTELLGRLISVQNETATIICSSTKNILKGILLPNTLKYFFHYHVFGLILFPDLIIFHMLCCPIHLPPTYPERWYWSKLLVLVLG